MDSTEGGMNNAFLLIYKIVAIISILAFAIIALLAAFDVYIYVKDEIKQKAKLALDPNIHNKDTTDVNAFGYLSTNAETEPYNIYLEQKIVNGVYTIIGLSVIIFAIQIASFFGLKLYSIINEVPFKEKLDLPIQQLGIILVVFIGIIVFNYTYKNTFIKITQPSIAELRKKMRESKTFIYSNMNVGSDAKFSNALASSDMDTILELLSEKIKRPADDTDSAVLDSNDMDAIRMIFTLNLYTYYQYEIPENSFVWDDLKTIFSVRGIQAQTFDPTLYFYYKKPIYITNMYPSMRKDISPLLGDREKAFVREISKMMRQLNLRLSRLQEISGGKSQLFEYLRSVFFISLIFLTIVLVVYFDKYQYVIDAAIWTKDTIIALWNKITQK